MSVANDLEMNALQVLEALLAMPWYTLPIGLSCLLAKLSSVDGGLRNRLSVLAVWLTLVGQQTSKES